MHGPCSSSELAPEYQNPQAVPVLGMLGRDPLWCWLSLVSKHDLLKSVLHRWTGTKLMFTHVAGAADLLQKLSGLAPAHVAKAPAGRKRPCNIDAGQQSVKHGEATHAGVTPRAPVAGSAHDWPRKSGRAQGHAIGNCTVYADSPVVMMYCLL